MICLIQCSSSFQLGNYVFLYELLVFIAHLYSTYFSMHGLSWIALLFKYPALAIPLNVFMVETLLDNILLPV